MGNIHDVLINVFINNIITDLMGSIKTIIYIQNIYIRFYFIHGDSHENSYKYQFREKSMNVRLFC